MFSSIPNNTRKARVRSNQPIIRWCFIFFLQRFEAERVGFEPTVPLRIHYLSRVANSTTLASLQLIKYPNLLSHFQIIARKSGEGGIRTLDNLAAIPVFETGRFNHSRTSPSLVSMIQIYRKEQRIQRWWNLLCRKNVLISEFIMKKLGGYHHGNQNWK